MYTPSLALPILAALAASTLAQGSSLSNSSPANMTITVYSALECTGSGSVGTVTYNTLTTGLCGNGTFLSYELSRDTTLQEQLGFSGPTPCMGVLDGNPKECTLYHETTSPDSNGNPLKANTCYGLRLGPAEVSTLFFFSRRHLSSSKC